MPDQPDPIAALASQRSGGHPSQRLLWEQLLQNLASLGMPGWEDLASDIPSLGAGQSLLSLLRKDSRPQEAMAAFQEALKSSEERTADWLLGLEVLEHHLRSENAAVGLREALGYLECCAVVIESGPRYGTFPDTVRTMLETYGFEGHQDTSSDP